MNGGDYEASIAYYCLHKFHKFPNEFLSLSKEEQAYVIAAIQIKAEDDKKKSKEMKRKSKR
ncbi:hypothetical protein FDF11_08300 [Clostridium botulinum]|nr:hypothetical protein [Clostridium botulinum]NFR13698.1 hypothetical protein [Clostridium botulinum]NFR42235.1 hypothetical protein [Clostridium botulinum]NFS50675.1 hypothetical protein [Clostridium botulinum]